MEHQADVADSLSRHKMKQITHGIEHGAESQKDAEDEEGEKRVDGDRPSR